MNKRFFGPCLLALASIFSFVTMPSAEGFKCTARDTYHQAWQLVKDNYYDPSFANQNWNAWEHRFDCDLHNAADSQHYIKMMLESLHDPYTRYLDPKAFKDENDAIDSKIVGIGINLLQKEHRLLVTRTIEGSPAANAGMRERDEIIDIDGTNSVGFTPEQAAEKIRGPEGSPVRITVRHSNNQEATFNIVRAQITIHAVSYKIVEPNIGYITLSTFISNDAAKEFRTALEKLSTCDGLIIDMRDNPGGLLSNSLEIADMLLENGVIVKTVGRSGPRVDTASGEPVTHQPIAVLVDEESASASEILAGALKDNSRGVIIGTHTYGKGLVQEINKLPGGAAIHITVSKYLTPSGTDINKIGVAPDIQCADREQQKVVALEYIKEKIASIKGGPNFKTSSLSISK
ncbi:MAG TPA: S41 family peptidase [Candidatus Obscuribacterales bacterium]